MTAVQHPITLDLHLYQGWPSSDKVALLDPKNNIRYNFRIMPKNVSNDELPSNVPNFKVGNVGREFVSGILRNSVGPSDRGGPAGSRPRAAVGRAPAPHGPSLSWTSLE